MKQEDRERDPVTSHASRLPCQGLNLESTLSKSGMLPVTPQGIEMAAEVGFEPTKLLFQRQVTLPIRPLGNEWLPQ